MKAFSSIQKVTKTGDDLVVLIPDELMKKYDVKVGETVNVSFRKIQPRKGKSSGTSKSK